MENSGLKMKISRLFQSSFASCKSKNISNDAINDKPLFYPQNIRPHYQLIDLFSPKPRPFPSICKPETSQTEQSCKNLLPRTKISDKSSLHDSHDSSNKSERRTNKKKTKKKKRLARSKIKRFEFYDEFTNICDYKGLFSSDEESEDDDKTTLFSSRSFSYSSDSSESFYRRNPRRRRTAAKGVKDSLAVVKRSSDPYSDFRESMLEMIMEKQIFAAKDLEKLLECFLSLNSQHHHVVIIDVFTEICETLFSNLS